MKQFPHLYPFTSVELKDFFLKQINEYNKKDDRRTHYISFVAFAMIIKWNNYWSWELVRLEHVYEEDFDEKTVEDLNNYFGEV